VEKRIRVVLYGDSLFLHGIARSLEGEPCLEVIRILPGTPEALPPAAARGAGLLIFDIHEASPELILTMFKKTPHLSLLALDPEGDRLIVLSGQASGARTIEDLIEVIQRHGEVETPGLDDDCIPDQSR